MGDLSNVHITPRRLSKPRTIKSSSNLLTEQITTPSSPHNPSDHDYFGTDAVVVNSHGQRRTRSRSRRSIRAYLYGSSNDVLQTSSDDEETQTGIAGAARDVRKRLSRTGSSLTPLQSAKASATRLSNSSSSGLLSTHSTESQGIDPEESAMIADQIKQKAYHDSLAAQNHVSTPVDEDMHVDSVIAPLRRKSLYTPGIATRNASDILRKPPKPSTDHDYYYDPSRPESSPLSHLAALSVGEDGRSTPCDLHYSHLGGLQLGTLRVTNGASSPIRANHPIDFPYRSVTPESKSHDEFYTASEGSVNEGGDNATPLPPRGGSPLKYGSRPESRIRTDNQAQSCPDSLSFERISSNESFPFSRQITDQGTRLKGQIKDESTRLRRETSSNIVYLKTGISNESSLPESEFTKTCFVEAMDPTKLLSHEKEAPNKASSFGTESHEKIEQLRGANSKGLSSLETGSINSRHVTRGTFDKPLPFKSKILKDTCFEEEPLRKSFCSGARPFKSYSAEERKSDERFPFEGKTCSGFSDIANEYIAEIDVSPFSYSSLEEKSNIIPHLHDSAKGMSRSINSDAEVQHDDSSNGSRENAFRKLNVNDNMPSTWGHERLSVPPAKPSRHSACSEVLQADSGYCSNASLPRAPDDEVGSKTRDGPNPSTKVAASPQPQTVENVRYSARSSFQIPIRKLKKQRPRSQPPPVNLTVGYHELADANIPRIPSFIAARHANRLSQFPLLEHTFPSSQHTSANGTLSPVLANGAPIRFPSPASAPEAASATFGSLPLASKKNRASTIAVDEGDWSASDLVRSPSWSEFCGDRRRKEQKKLAKEEKEIEKKKFRGEKELERKLKKTKKELERQLKKDGKKQKSSRSRSASRTRARSSEGHSRHDTLVTIADFGTVTECLGNSPYDIATSTFPGPQNAKHWHPHQISTAMPRPKSSLNARTLSQNLFSDMPSVPALAAVDIKTHNLEWARNRQRSQTSFVARAESFNIRGGIPDELVRPRSVTMGVAPPVPPLPSAKQVERREAESTRSRSHSLMVEAPVPTPTIWKTEEQTAITYPSETSTRVSPRKRKGSNMVPDLWSNGSLERKSPGTVEGSRQAFGDLTSDSMKPISTQNNGWEIASSDWSQRRKSAGEALLEHRVRDLFHGQEVANPNLPREHNDKLSLPARTFISGSDETLMPISSHQGPFPDPLASMNAPQSTSASKTSSRHYGVTTQETQRYSFDSLTSPPGPPLSSASHGNQISTFTSIRAPTQSFRIPRKRVGSGPSAIHA